MPNSNLENKDGARPLSRAVVTAQAIRRMATKDRARAQKWITAALAEFPEHPAIKAANQAVLRMPVPRWHYAMLNDHRRNQAYQAAIGATVRPGMRVLEVGTGAGLLAMMIAAAGAEHVVTCEVVPEIAVAAREVIARNRLEDRITVINARSTDLTAADIGGRADLLVTETFGVTLVDEGALTSIPHAMQNLVKPTGAAIPKRGRIVAALAADLSGRGASLASVAGFDLSPFDRFRAREDLRRLRKGKLELRGPAETLFAFDFQSNAIPMASMVERRLIASEPGANAVVAWLELDLTDSVTYSGAVDDPNAHWGILVNSAGGERANEPGAEWPIIAFHDGATFALHVD